MGNGQFRPDEIVILTHFDKAKKEYVKTPHPKVGGRLRLAHEDNGEISIKTEIIQFEEGMAVVKAETTTQKGTFAGLGTASAGRDERLAESLLELAETRAIARSLRFSGYGVEYCSAEEVSHLEGEREEPASEAEASSSSDGGNGQPSQNTGNGNDRLTNAQLRAIHSIGKRKNLGHKALNEMTVKMFNVKVEALTKDQASTVITTLQQ